MTYCIVEDMHRTLRSVVLSSCLLMPLPAALAQNPHSPTTLSQLQDRYRVLLVFAPKPDDPALLAQLHMLKDAAAELSRRDLLLIAVPYDNPSPSEVSLTPEAARKARRDFDIAPDRFAALLLGKDGGEKLRSAKPVSLDGLRSLIDSMPMRQQEMRNPERR